MLVSIIPIHSTVDLVTNSSSEVFIGNKLKTVEAVKDIIGAIYFSNKWPENNGVFQEPIISEFNFHPVDGYPKERESFDFSWSDTPPEIAAHEKLCPKWPEDKASKMEQKKHDKEYRTWFKKLEKIKAVVYKEERKESKKRLLNFYRTLCRENGVKMSDLGKCHISYYNDEADIHFDRSDLPPNKRIDDFMNLLGLCEHWGININKGDVVLFSADDNTVDYDRWDDINAALGGTNYHLG